MIKNTYTVTYMLSSTSTVYGRNCLWHPDLSERQRAREFRLDNCHKYWRGAASS
jgi:hypothetical protein